MFGLGVFSLIAGALQLVVPSYALRLVRRFGTRQVGWFIVTVFASLALLHLTGLMKNPAASPASGARLDLVYLIGSVLLVIGMGHVETLFSERQQARWNEESLRRTLQSRIQNETADLIAAKEELLQELAHREEIAKALNQSKAHYRFLFEENPQPMLILDLRSCRFLAVNQAGLRLYGFAVKEFLALTGRDLVLPADAASFLQDAAKRCPGVESRGVWKHCTKNGTLIDVEITAVDFPHGDSSARLMLATDITRRRRREAQLQKAHKREVIGQIAGGVASHFNTLFTMIDAEADALMDRPQDLQSTEQLEHIHAAVTRASSLTRQLLAAGGKQAMKPEPVDLNEVIRNMNQMLCRLLGDPIVLENIYGFHTPPILADRPLIERAIVQLVLNAREAMTGSGTLTLRTARVCVAEDEAAREPQARAGEFVRLDVRDTGCGMTPQVQENLFEPFFSTRDPGKGIGLGLASVYGIVSQHSGWIEFITEPGAGTEFRVFLPCAPASASLDDAKSRSTAPTIKGTILLVEAEDRVRALARFVLNHYGYRVIEADSSATALVLWAGQASMVDLLLTDLNLPGEVSGAQLADQLRQARPDLKVVYAADEQSSAESQDPAPSDGSKYIPKPYNPEDLLQTVQGLLSP
jgi:PAS domain S-box-containing protein